MVSTLSIIFMTITCLTAFLLPIGLVIYFYKKQRISMAAVGVGAAMFFISQILIRFNLLKIFSTQPWYISMSKNIWAIALFLGITAGLFEEAGRFVGFKYLLKGRLERKNGIAYGIGHGGIEAIFLVGFAYINNIIYSTLINSGAFSMISKGLPQNLAEQIKDSLIDTHSYLFLIGGIERVFTMAIQIALSLVVLYGVMNRKNIYLLYAVLLHALVDTPTVILSKYLGIWVTEGFVAICALISLIFIIKSKKMFIINPGIENEVII